MLPQIVSRLQRARLFEIHGFCRKDTNHCYLENLVLYSTGAISPRLIRDPSDDERRFATRQMILHISLTTVQQACFSVLGVAISHLLIFVNQKADQCATIISAPFARQVRLSNKAELVMFGGPSVSFA